MKDINSKISICPVCGRKLVKVKYSHMDNTFNLCIKSDCRTTIRNGVIDTMSIDEFSRITEKLNIRKDKCTTFMLLKEDLSGPMLKKVTTSPLERDKSMYCIVQANSLDEAVEKFTRHFNIVKIKNEMVIPITIKEE